MNNKNNGKESVTGPQGTQVFELDAINKLIAEEIAESQSEFASIPALIGVSQNVSGQCFKLDKDKLEVGRRPSSNIVLQDSSVSSMHAQIIRDGEGWKVLNLLSSNGTFVNGEKIVERKIKTGDRVAFAGTEFVFSKIEDLNPPGKTSKNLILFVAAITFAVAFGGLFYFVL